MFVRESEQYGQMADYFSIFDHLHQWKIPQLHLKFAKVGSKEWQTFNKLSKIDQFFRSYQSGDLISPNLVTLHLNLHKNAKTMLFVFKTKLKNCLFLLKWSLLFQLLDLLEIPSKKKFYNIDLRNQRHAKWSEWWMGGGTPHEALASSGLYLLQLLTPCLLPR